MRIRDIDDALRFLPTIALFGGMQESTLKRIAATLQEHELEPGKIVCRQGEVGRSMFIVRKGEVVVTRETPKGRKVRMIRLGQGEFFGEMTLIDIQKRSATVVVEKQSLLYSLGNRELYSLYEKDTAGYVLVIQNLCRELSRRLRTTNARLSEMAEESTDDRTQIRRIPPI